MKYIIKDLEQLIEAHNQLKRETPIGARLALILLDNLAEIQMYRSIKYFFGQLDSSKYEDINISPSKRHKIENHFRDKVNFLVRYNIKDPLNGENGTLDVDAGDVLKVCHILRNDAYHRDILREDVLVPIVKVHFQIISKMFLLFNHDCRSWRSSLPKEQVNEFLSKYNISIKTNIGTEFLGQCIMSRDSVEEILTKFSIETTVHYLTQILCQNILDRIKIINEGLFEIYEYEKNFFNYVEDRDEILERLQDYDDSDRVIVSRDIKNWENMAKNLLNENEFGITLQKWQNIDNKLSKIELEVMNEANYVHFLIQDEIDKYRLK